MNYDFDRIIDRTNTGALKLEVLRQRYGRDDLLALWVADMDFETPEPIVSAIRNRMNHPIFGYTVDPAEYWPTVQKWILDHHDWHVQCDWLTYIPGVVKGIGFAINALTNPGDKIVIQTPVYHPFRMTIEGNGRQVVLNPLKESGGESFYEMDFDHLTLVIDGAKMLVLCNPHNPAGIAWRKDTLQRLAQICHSRGVVVVSDEIHADLAIFGHKHTPFATVSDEAREISVTFQAPTKTFNMAGIVSSYAIVPNDNLRQRLYGWISANELNEPNVFAPIATIAAYKHCEPWRKAMLGYIEQNILFVEDYLKQNIPSVRAIRPESSFLLWLDCRQLGLNHDQLLDLFINKARLALNDGEIFDTASNPYQPLHNEHCASRGFMRLNVGTPRSVLAKAFQQLKSALD
ncbi:MAG: MalY/PatB family protein [Muribaculaceae bacterium]